MKTVVKAFFCNTQGATALEYCFIATLVSIAAITAITSVGISTKTMTEGVLTAFR